MSINTNKTVNQKMGKMLNTNSANKQQYCMSYVCTEKKPADY